MSWFFKKINQIGKTLSRLTKEKKRVQINKIINERGDVLTDTTKKQRIMRLLCTIKHNKLDNPEEMEKLLSSTN